MPLHPFLFDFRKPLLHLEAWLRCHSSARAAGFGGRRLLAGRGQDACPALQHKPYSCKSCCEEAAAPFCQLAVCSKPKEVKPYSQHIHPAEVDVLGGHPGQPLSPGGGRNVGTKMMERLGARCLLWLQGGEQPSRAGCPILP